MSTLHLSNGWYELPNKTHVAKRKQSWERFKRHFRQFTAFMFSNVGIILLVIFYTIAGAFIFQGIEIFEYEKIKQDSETIAFLKERNHSNDYLQMIWSVTANNISFYNHWSFKSRVNEILLDYQRIIVRRELQTLDMEKQWSFSGAFLYSLTVITTIGYGNISPRSDWGKVVTILYAIIGMPLFLLYLSNIGDVLAKSFKWIYSKICLCRLCPGVAKRRQLRERRKLYHMSISRAMSTMDNTKVYYRKTEPYANYDNNNNNNNNNNGCSFSNGDGSTRSNTNSYSSTSNSNSNSNSNESSFTTSTGGESNISFDNISTTNIHPSLNDASLHNSNIELTRFIANDDIDVACDLQNNGNIDEITVPLTICVLIMISYILWGALLFGRWEDWNYLDGSYFCFISLSSIGFGDLVPGDRVITAHKDRVEVSFILCAVYLLLGMALIAMCFNLMQEQVIHNIRSIKRAFKACFRCG